MTKFLKIFCIVIWIILLAAVAYCDEFGTKDFRSVWNKTTGQTSVPLCGPNGTGLFVNSTDTGGVSCIDANGPLQQGGLVWIHMNSSIYIETNCAIMAYNGCGVLPGNTTSQCDTALPYQAFRASDLGYAGESLSFGGPLVQPVVKEFKCPTPRPTFSPTAAASATPGPSPTRTASPTPTNGSTITARPTATPGCFPPFCAPPLNTPVASPSPSYTSTPSPTSTAVPTAAPSPAASPSATPDVKPPRTITPAPVTRIPTFTPTDVVVEPRPTRTMPVEPRPSPIPPSRTFGPVRTVVRPESTKPPSRTTIVPTPTLTAIPMGTTETPTPAAGSPSSESSFAAGVFAGIAAAAIAVGAAIKRWLRKLREKL